MGGLIGTLWKSYEELSFTAIISCSIWPFFWRDHVKPWRTLGIQVSKSVSEHETIHITIARFTYSVGRWSVVSSNLLWWLIVVNKMPAWRSRHLLLHIWAAANTTRDTPTRVFPGELFVYIGKGLVSGKTNSDLIEVISSCHHKNIQNNIK